MFPHDVKESGLNLSEIRQLSRILIDAEGGDCNKCGRISVEELSKNSSREGWLEFDWDDNPGCLDNCIDPEKQIKPTATPTPTPILSLSTKRTVETWGLPYGVASCLPFWAALLLGVFAML